MNDTDPLIACSSGFPSTVRRLPTTSLWTCFKISHISCFFPSRSFLLFSIHGPKTCQFWTLGIVKFLLKMCLKHNAITFLQDSVFLSTWYMFFNDFLEKYCFSKACCVWRSHFVKPVTNSSLLILLSPSRSKICNTCSTSFSSSKLVSVTLFLSRRSLTSEADIPLLPSWSISLYNLLQCCAYK